MPTSALLQKYAPTIFAALVVLIPAADVLAKNPSLAAILQFIALIVTTITTYRLLGKWKQIAEWIGVVVTAVLPLAITGDVTWANWALVATAVVKALAVHFGSIVRGDDTIDARETPDGEVANITSLPVIGDDDAVTPGDGLASPPPATDDEPGRHAAATTTE